MIARIRDNPVLVAALVQAILGLIVAFGVHLTAEQTAAILAVTGTLMALVVRARVTPTTRTETEA